MNDVDFEYVLTKTDEVLSGASATPPPDPARPGYVFTGWDKPFTNVSSDISVYAEYERDIAYDNPRYVAEVNMSTTLFRYGGR